MSHWKRFESNVLADVKMDVLKLAAKDIGVDVDESITNIRNTWGNETVSAGLKINGSPVSLGFNFKNVDGKTQLELTGDFYCTGLNESTFIDQLSQSYQKHNAIEKLQEQGWQMDSIETNEKGEIVIEAYQWA